MESAPLELQVPQAFYPGIKDKVGSAMDSKSSKGKEIKIPGQKHPITISAAEGKVRVTAAGRIVAESAHAFRLEEKGYPAIYYLPRSDQVMSLFVRTTHYT